jgi:hypothetical protein
MGGGAGGGLEGRRCAETGARAAHEVLLAGGRELAAAAGSWSGPMV